MYVYATSATAVDSAKSLLFSVLLNFNIDKESAYFKNAIKKSI